MQMNGDLLDAPLVIVTEGSLPTMVNAAVSLVYG